MAKHFSKSTETRDELSTTCNPKVMSRCLSAPDAASLHHCLKNKQLKLILLFQLYGGIVNHMQVLATPSSTVHNTRSLPLKAYSF